MKFYDRTKELEMLRFALEQSRKESRMTVVTGRRRIGKTELIKRCGDDTVSSDEKDDHYIGCTVT